MRARRAETPARLRRSGGSATTRGATAARRGWAQSYRALPRAQPGPERSAGTRPHPPFAVAVLRHSLESEQVPAVDGDDGAGDVAGVLGAEEHHHVRHV